MNKYFRNITCQVSRRKHSLTELVGKQRMLVENHLGIIEYGETKIILRVDFGCLSIEGAMLQIVRMTDENLIITGQIDTLNLVEGGE